MLIAFWIVNGLAALVFLAAGIMKLARPREALTAAGMAWAGDFASPSVKLIGLAEALGGLGLVLPLLTGIAAILSPIAGVALAVVMVGAIVVHVRRSESAVPAAVLLVLALAAAILGFLVVLG
ncbi:DoxX family protein [Leifsonia sp. NPDC058230]|uniref:DoxX family protein n=1 Tax=Leifsonia sp. NPDC058230 TaxID=3346391 RepID=UPI0036DF4962